MNAMTQRRRTAHVIGAGHAAVFTVALIAASSVTSAAAPPEPAPRVSVVTPRAVECGLTRVGDQLMRCDTLTGDGVAAPPWVPEQAAAVLRAAECGLTRIGRQLMRCDNLTGAG